MSLTPEDRAAILDLAARYCHTIDLGDPEGWAACFTADGSFEGAGRVVKGTEALRKMAAAPVPAPFRHLPSVFQIEGDGPEARLSCYFTLLRLDDDAPRTLAVGRYHDELVKQDGSWKFAKVQALLDWADPSLQA